MNLKKNGDISVGQGSVDTMNRLLLILTLLTLTRVAQGQVDLKHFDYTKADSVALNFPKKKYKSYTEIVVPLTEKLGTEQEKFRAIFRWVTNNISYSYSNRSSDPDRAIKKGKAVCSGYSNLLKAMCNSVGIECEVITGFSKTADSDIDKPLKKTDHAWNSVKLNNKWYLVDATWAWGYQNEKKKFIKEYNETYFLADNDFFHKKHYPKDKNWILSEKSIKKSDFKKSPIFYSNYLADQIELVKPTKGIIRMKLKDSLKIEFKSFESIERISVSTNPKKPSTLMQLKKVQNKDGSTLFIGTTKFDKPTKTAMTVFINGRSTLTYRLTVK